MEFRRVLFRSHDFLSSLGLVVPSEADSSVVVGDDVSPSSVDGRVRIALALRVDFGEGFASEARSGLAAEEACVRAEDFLFADPVPAAADETTSPGLAVAPAVPVTSVPALAPLEGA